MASQQHAPTAPAMSHLEFVAMDPGVKGFFVAPTCDHHNLIRAFRAQDLHIDEARELLHEPPPVSEPFDDLIGHAFFHR
jgi:hypothetical protein